MTPPSEQKLPEVIPTGPPSQSDKRTDLIEDIRVLRRLVTPHEKAFDSRGTSMFAQAVESVLEHRLAELGRLRPES